mgnify:CR=1 FL=1
MSDCGVMVDEYDHTCPWTGTAIGGKNIKYFYGFTVSIIPLAIFLIITLVMGLGNRKDS